VRDNKFQLATALGLEDDVPGGYFLLLYTALQRCLNLRSGSSGLGPRMTSSAALVST
jgi:hypothetical protein